MTGPADNSAERRRLAALYGQMSEAELLKLAAEQDGLTDTAYDALADELERRGLQAALDAAPARTEQVVDYRKLVPLRRFRDLLEAQLAKGILDSAGIESFLGDENVVRMDWFWSNMVGGVKLLVRPEDFVAASEALNQSTAEELPAADEPEPPVCPACGSRNVHFEAIDKPVSYTLMFFSIPFPVKKNAWKCDDCGAQWRVEPDAADQAPES